ncbi:MAG: hypothetical protein HQL60_08380 [Magnetococcales bacterium]|nr:hypothetical protein [Magnetococcales bacterium]
MNGKNIEDASLLSAAMNQAVEAERQAAAAVIASRREAEEILIEARRRAGEIAARTDRRIVSIQKIRAKVLKKRLDKRMESIKHHHQRQLAFLVDNQDNSAIIAAAVARLASRLVGFSHRSGGEDS